MTATNSERTIHRGRTAIERHACSQPIRLALRDTIIKPELSFFDYGCGRGADVSFLAGQGVTASGFDPCFFPQNSKTEAHVVNLGYVINVIENPDERITVLKDAFALAQLCLIVAAQTKSAAISGATAFNDGCVTKRNTFQKYYGQSELRELLQQVLSVAPYSAGPGIFYVFKDEQARNAYLAVRYDSTRLLRFNSNRMRQHQPVQKLREQRLQNSAAVGRLIDWVSMHARFPSEFEFPALGKVLALGVSHKFLQEWVFANLDQEVLATARKIRQQDILLMLALTRFDGRPKFSALPDSTKHDIKSFFTSYQKACAKADRLLFSVGNVDTIRKEIERSEVGKKLPDSLYVHTSAIPYLPLSLQVFIGCGRAVVGDMEGDVIVKIPKKATSVSFLLYREFDNDPHPELQLAIKVDLRSGHSYPRDYSKSDNPPLLHRKETFVTKDYPQYAEFCRVTEHEEKLGLLNRNDIGNRQGWRKALTAVGDNAQPPTA
ncbi:MAG: DNA phosphorothioation-associated putative methyltransferase [Pseudomonadota bacterium]|nr:DNA phosphorothioation-associated putative methyltransferase [Pseudomonadota bacterium]